MRFAGRTRLSPDLLDGESVTSLIDPPLHRARIEPTPLAEGGQAQAAVMPLVDQGRPTRRPASNPCHGRASAMGTPAVPSSRPTQPANRCGSPDGQCAV